MARPRSTEPTDGELEILCVLWEHGPCELGVITRELRRSRPVATTTVATRLGVMLDKDLVRRKEGPKGYLWASRGTRRKTAGGLVRKLVDSTFDGSALGLVAHILESEKLSAKEREEIRQLLEGDKEGRKRRRE